MYDANVGQQGVGPVAAPALSSVPELEQVLVKIQELEQRIGDCELALAKDATGEGHENNFDNSQQTDTSKGNPAPYQKMQQKMESLVKTFKEISKVLKEADEMTGVPEVEKDKEKKTPESEGNLEVPKAITSEVKDDGTKQGAPVAGEETGLDAGKKDNREKDTEAEKDAEGKVPKPSSDYPKEASQKNALENQPSKEAPKEPNKMKDEEGKKVPQNKGYEEQYKELQEKMIKENLKRIEEAKARKEKALEILSGRKTVVGASSIKESLNGVSFGSKQTAVEYLNKAGIRFK